MLKGSVLGAIYRCWLGSVAFALLQSAWRAVRRLGRGSRIPAALFGTGRLAAWYADSLFSRVVHAPLRGAAFLCRGVAAAGRGSRVCAFLAPAFRSSAFLNYEFLLGLFCCVMFIVPHESWNNLYAAAGSFLLLALCLLRRAARREEQVPKNVLGPGVAALALACVLSLGSSSDLGDSARILLLFLGAFLLCWQIATGFADAEKLRRLVSFLYICLLVVSAIGIMQRVLGTVEVNKSFTDLHINEGVPGRIYATLDNPNNLSGFIQMFLPLGAAYAAGTKKPGARALLFLGLLLPVVALVMTYSRAGWMAVALAALVAVWRLNKRALPLLLIAALLAVPLLPASVLTRLGTIGNTADTSTAHRFAIWSAVLRLLGDKAYWLTGIGLGPATFLNIYPPYAYGMGRTGAYHSQMMYLEMDLEMGVLGLLALLYLLLKFSGRAWRDSFRGGDRFVRLVLVSVAATFAALAFSGIVEYLWFYQRCIYAFFIFLGVAVAAMRCAECGVRKS